MKLRPTFASVARRLLSRSFPLALMLGLLTVCWAAAGLAQKSAKPEPETETTPTPAPTPKSVISGRVIYADTQRPLRRVQMTLISLGGNNGGEYPTASDEQGYFRFKNVAAGSYVVAVNAPGIITPTAYLSLPDERAGKEPDYAEIRKNFEPVTVDGDNSVEIKVHAQRGGAVSGKITYDNGDPAINVQITLLRKQENGKTTPVFTSTGLASFARLRTDDRGEYRVAGLPPGEYLVCATEANTNPDQDGANGEDRYLGDIFVNDALSRTYYGDTTDAKQAHAVKVELANESGNIDIRLVEVTSHLISGTLTRRDGRPIVNTTLRLAPKEKSLVNPFVEPERTTNVDAEGAWSFKGVPDGAYTITAEAPYEEAPNPNSKNGEPSYHRTLVRKQVELTIMGGDQTGVNIQMSDGGVISGTVIIEGAKQRPEDSYSVCLRAEKMKDPSGLWNPWELSSCAGEDRKITLEGMPGGEFRILPGLPENYYVKSMSAKGVDLLKQPLAIAEGEEIRDLRIVVAQDTAKITVRARAADNKPLRNAPLVFVSADPFQMDDASSYRRVATDAQGVWTDSCAPGEYLVFFPTFEELPRFANPEYVRQQSAQAQRLTLRAGERKVAELTVPR